MTIFSVARAGVENGNILGFKLTEEQVLGCQAVKPGFYDLVHGYINLAVEIGQDDTVSIVPESVEDVSERGTKFKFGGAPLSQLLERKADKLSIVPKFGETALTVGPDNNGVTLSLERHANHKVAPVAIGMVAIESAVMPVKSKTERPASFGGSVTE